MNSRLVAYFTICSHREGQWWCVTLVKKGMSGPDESDNDGHVHTLFMSSHAS